MAGVKSYLFLIGSLKKGGAERNLSLVASDLAELGHHVEVALFEKVIEFSLHPSVVITDLDIMRHRKGVVRIWMMFWKVTSLVWSRRPFQIVAFTRLASQFLALTFYPRTVVRYDIFPFYMKTRRWLSSVILFNLPGVRTVVSPSLRLKSMLNKYFIARKKIRVIPNPVAQISQDELQQTVSSRSYFLVCGRLAQQKGVDLIINAYKKSGACEQLDLVVMGDGPEKEKLQKLSHDLGLNNHVIFTGFVQKPFAFMARAHATILGSYREGFPNVLVESLSLGTPVISSDCPTGPDEIVIEGSNGFLFPVGDVDALADRMNLILRPDIYDGLRENAAGSVAKYDRTTILAAWRDVTQAMK